MDGGGLRFAVVLLLVAYCSPASGEESLQPLQPAIVARRLPEIEPAEREMKAAEESPDTEEEDSDEQEESDEEEAAATLLSERLHRLGPITAEYFYAGETFNNAHGGIRTSGATRYRGNLDLTLRLDTEQAGWWDGGEFYVYAQHSHGTTLSPNFVGDGQYYSNIDTGPRPQDLTQLGEYWYRHAWNDDALSVRIGRQDANVDFAFAEFGADFLNSSFVTLPNIPMPFWPFQTLGASTLYQPTEKLRWGGGAYDQGANEQQWWVNTVSRGMFFINQIDYRPFADQADSLTTIVRLGGWFTSSDTEAVDTLSVFENNYGLYCTLDRMLFLEADSDDQGLGMFFQFSWAPSDRNQVDRHFGAGMIYRGLLPSRDADVCGFGFTLIEFSGELRDLTGQTYENAVEVFYKARVREWLAVQPDVQYIAHPFGLQHDALVVGVRMEANF